MGLRQKYDIYPTRCLSGCILSQSRKFDKDKELWFKMNFSRLGQSINRVIELIDGLKKAQTLRIFVDYDLLINV